MRDLLAEGARRFMPYEYLEDDVTSDVTIRARAPTLDGLFRAAADATTNVMVARLDEVDRHEIRAASVEAEELDLLLLRFLEEIIFLKDAEGLLLRVVSVHVERKDGLWTAKGQLAGEPLSPDKHSLAADVKAVTLHGLRVEWTHEGWEARVTLDV